MGSGNRILGCDVYQDCGEVKFALVVSGILTGYAGTTLSDIGQGYKLDSQLYACKTGTLLLSHIPKPLFVFLEVVLFLF